jgi:hypothetical protein
MNRGQRIVIGVGIVVILLMALYPPWVYTYPGSGLDSERWASYTFLLIPPMVHGVRLDITLLSLQWGAVIVVIAALVFALRKRKPGPLN